MPYGNLLADVVQGSVANTPPAFRDGNGTQVGTLCRAWVNFNGTGTVAIRASFNVSSITDNGVGDYTVNFTNVMPDANYAVSLSRSALPSTGFITVNDPSASPTASAIRIGCGNSANTLPQDTPFTYVAIFR